MSFASTQSRTTTGISQTSFVDFRGHQGSVSRIDCTVRAAELLIAADMRGMTVRTCCLGRLLSSSSNTCARVASDGTTGYQGLSRIHLRGIYPGIISLIIRNMGLDDIFGFEYAFLSERIIILQTAQAANYIVFSGDLLYSSISDWHGVSHVWRRYSARSQLRRRRNASEEW